MVSLVTAAIAWHSQLHTSYNSCYSMAQPNAEAQAGVTTSSGAAERDGTTNDTSKMCREDVRGGHDPDGLQRVAVASPQARKNNEATASKDGDVDASPVSCLCSFMCMQDNPRLERVIMHV